MNGYTTPPMTPMNAPMAPPPLALPQVHQHMVTVNNVQPFNWNNPPQGLVHNFFHAQFLQLQADVQQDQPVLQPVMVPGFWARNRLPHAG